VGNKEKTVLSQKLGLGGGLLHLLKDRDPLDALDDVAGDLFASVQRVSVL
jgi:hypothetical protein